MNVEKLLPYLRCPVTKSPLELEVFEYAEDKKTVISGVLSSAEGWFFPVINGVPRMLVEAFVDHRAFLQKYVKDYEQKSTFLQQKWGDLIAYSTKKNQRTKDSFAFEWGLLDYDEDKVWGQDRTELVQQFYEESGENADSLKGKVVLDAGCGHGILSNLVAEQGAGLVIGMDLSLAIERAMSSKHDTEKVLYIQGDLMFPPLALQSFDLVHSSGVIHHTYSTELSFSIIHELVKPKGGKLCVWLYHPIDSFIHKCFTFARPFTCRFPLRFQYIMYHIFLFPIAYIAKKMNGKKVNRRELMIDLMDGLSPEYRYEHSEQEATSWYAKRGYIEVKATAKNLFGFAIFGVRN